ncbi:class I SAM-dependent methyltransferase [uncultured Draconibacterium sp.]|uniref:class I SAM-dependent methyltransferase n=1 Tax=uncultured Draconibacterium sp. TaxID=1573823 RepID=UPI0029C78313|nr:class I SAM-dependent methyltransferase [uncultured Draconibacterium sp.]
MKCRHCKTPLKHVFLNLGYAPHSNAYLNHNQLAHPEKEFPLKLCVCHNCWLVQTEDYSNRADLFTDDYAYFSSVSSSWLKHSQDYAKMIQKRLELNSDSFVIEIASNDGYLLKNFVAEGIPCVGIEPTDSTADVSEKIGVPVIREFFGEKFAQNLAKNNQQADLIIGNNVYAHVPDINDFTLGLKAVLKPGGTITLEFPHLLNLIRLKQFDTAYHEHYSYLSLYTVSQIFEMAGLRIFDVEKLSTHGGSLRVYGCHSENARQTTEAVTAILNEEKEYGLQDLSVYSNFQSEADKIETELIHFLTSQKKNGKKVSAYGAAAKGNTLLNYGKIDNKLIDFVCDAAPSKQGKYLPGSHIPVYHPNQLTISKPDYVLILPWNLKEEISNQIKYVREWGGKLVIPAPELTVLD